MATTKRWTIKLYELGDEARIRKLYELVLGKEFSEERWNWQYRDNPTGVLLIGLAEGNNGELVGQCALWPAKIKVGEKICVGAQSLDAMVHPDYRRQGIYSELATYMYRIAAEMGISIIYGFPNKNSHRLLAQRLGRVDLWDHPPIYVRILDVEPLLAERIGQNLALALMAPLGRVALSLLAPRAGSTLPPDCQLMTTDRFDDRFDHFWETASRTFRIAVVRDKRYLNWRYIENTTDQYTVLTVERGSEIVGYIILKCETRFGLKIGYVADLLTLPDEPRVSQGLISEAARFFQAEHVHLVSCLVLEHRSTIRSLKRNGFRRLPKWLLPQELHLSVRSLSDHFPTAFVTDPRNWFISWGDHDVI
jgi:GNAT superfamily N-acetyltransferase